MKSFIITLLASFAAASPILERQTAGCNTPGTKGRVPASLTPYFTDGPVAGGPAKGTLSYCRALCYSPAHAQCRSFAIRENASSGGACQLFNTDITASVIPDSTTTYTYYPLPAGIQGWVPENVAKHYKADNSAAAGSYTACRQICLNEGGRCRGFGYKQGAKCQLYDVSLVGKVKADSTSPYIQWQMDCQAAPPITVVDM